jgi:hypothetical protein
MSQATNPKEELRKPKNIRDGYLQVDVTDWCEHYNLDMALMPFDYRSYDPIAACRRIKETLDDMHRLAQTLMSKDCGISNLAGAKTLNPLFRLYRVTEQGVTSKGLRYKNPQYEHYDECIHPITDPEARKEFYDKWRTVPTVDGEWYGKHFGITPSRFYRWVKGHGYVSFREQDYHNRECLGRTIATIAKWTAYSQRELMRLLPMPMDKIDGHVQRHVRDTEWEPPERPSDKPWFRSD